MRNIINNVRYYFWASYRRKELDKLLERNKDLFHGVVLDIGGRGRGKFKKPKDEVEKWIYADIVKENNPDIVLDIMNMQEINTASIDIINATELFEHVENTTAGLSECYRVLKKGGLLIVSAPFLYPLHADPYDFQRWTNTKWQKEFKKIGFEIKKEIVMGYYFLILADMLKAFVKILPIGLKQLSYLFYPLLDFMVFCDGLSLVSRSGKLNKYHSGYFYVISKHE